MPSAPPHAFLPSRRSQIDKVSAWYLVIGSLLILMGLTSSVLKRLPLSPAMLYLGVGYLLGPAGVGVVTLDPFHNAHWLTQIAEVALLISLFAVGLRLRVAIADPLWWLPVRLGVIGMLATIALLTGAGMLLAGLPFGGALLLAAMLAPTDPVLASDVQIQDVGDRDSIRFSLSGEGGLNDGTTYPFVMLGLFLLGVPQAQAYHGAGAAGVMLWGVAAGLLCGWLTGRGVSALALYLRRRYRQALGMEEFFTLGVIALSYGVTHLVHGIGFVAVFAAGVAMRHIEHQASGDAAPSEVIGAVTAGKESEVATHPAKAPAYMTEIVLDFNQQLEHIAEFTMVLMLGVMLSAAGFSAEGALIAALLLLVVRPIACAIALVGQPATAPQRWLTAWFGIRGIGSFYYLVFALQYPWQGDLKARFVPLVLTVVTISIVAHGITSTPLMERYYKRWRGR